MSQSDKPVAISASPKDAPMSDTAHAQDLLHLSFPVRSDRNVKAAIGQAFKALQRRESALPRSIVAERKRQWTERRVRSLWSKTAGRVDHYEIQDLTAVAVEEARIERQRQQARDARLAALIASTEAGANQPGNQWLGGRSGGLDNAGTAASEADAEYDQRNEWGR